MKLAALATTALLAGCSHSATSLGVTRATPPAIETTAQILGPSGELRGTATLTPTATGTQIRVRVEGLAPGTYAVHLHATGRCDGPDFASAGGHFNPAMMKHGKDNPLGPHLGDLPNVVVSAGGSGSVNFTVAGMMLVGGSAPLLDADGAAVIVHAGPDDYRSDPSGNSGARIACGAFAPR